MDYITPYAPVICNHAPHPRGRAGDGGENVLGSWVSAGILRFVPKIAGLTAVRGKNTAVQGQIAEALPKVCPRSMGLLAAWICWKKSQSPHYSA